MSEKDEISKLLDLVANSPEAPLHPSENEELSEAHRFVLSVGIKDGHWRVPALLVWDRYKKWCLDLGRKPIPKLQFFRSFAKLFVPYRRPHHRFYRLDPAPFNLDKEYYVIKLFEMQGERRKRLRVKERKLQKALAKEQCEVSGPDQGGTPEESP